METVKKQSGFQGCDLVEYSWMQLHPAYKRLAELVDERRSADINEIGNISYKIVQCNRRINELEKLIASVLCGRAFLLKSGNVLIFKDQAYKELELYDSRKMESAAT